MRQEEDPWVVMFLEVVHQVKELQEVDHEAGLWEGHRGEVLLEEELLEDLLVEVHEVVLLDQEDHQCQVDLLLEAHEVVGLWVADPLADHLQKL